MTFWQPFWILAAILEFKENYFQQYRFLGIVNIHFDLFYCFLRHLQAKICKFPEFGGHLGKMANRKKCSTFGVWLQTDLDSAAQNLMETIIKVYICLKTRSREISIDRGSTRGSGRVGSGRVGSGRVGSGHEFAGLWRVGSGQHFVFFIIFYWLFLGSWIDMNLRIIHSDWMLFLRYLIYIIIK